VPIDIATLSPGLHHVTMEDFSKSVAPPNMWIKTYSSLGDMCTSLLQSPIESIVIADLTNELRRDGRFAEPLRVEDGALSDGCHRFTALYATSTKSFDIWVASPDEKIYTRAAPPVEVTFRVTGDERYNDDFDEFTFNAMIAACSLPTPRGWLHSDGGGFCLPDLASYDYDEDMDFVRQALPWALERFLKVGITAVLVDIREHNQE
jgi:hypothetical protein